MAEPRADLRRYPRVRVTRKVLVEVPGSRPRLRRIIDVSPFGMKVSLDTRLGLGTEARLSLATRGERPLRVNAIVWRTDPAGPVFLFVGLAQEVFKRLKILVDSYLAG